MRLLNEFGAADFTGAPEARIVRPAQIAGLDGEDYLKVLSLIATPA